MFIVAHRGAEDLALENSMSAFHAAGSADAFELDVHATFDNHLVVIHDRTAKRVASKTSALRTNPIASLPLAQVKEIELIDGSHIPTLEEVLEATSLPVQIEIKAPGAVAPLAALMHSRPEFLQRALFICFIDAALIELVDRLPDARVGVLRAHAGEDLTVLDTLPKKNLAAYLPSWKALELSTITSVQSRGIKVGCWTIRDQATLELAHKAGVDYATVSDPTRFSSKKQPTEHLIW